MASELADELKDIVSLCADLSNAQLNELIARLRKLQAETQENERKNRILNLKPDDHVASFDGNLDLTGKLGIYQTIVGCEIEAYDIHDFSNWEFNGFNQEQTPLVEFMCDYDDFLENLDDPQNQEHRHKLAFSPNARWNYEIGEAAQTKDAYMPLFIYWPKVTFAYLKEHYKKITCVTENGKEHFFEIRGDKLVDEDEDEELTAQEWDAKPQLITCYQGIDEE